MVKALLSIQNMTDTSDEVSLLLRLINQTQQNIFLTGRAGTGKTTLLKKIVSTTHKNCVVVAPTGIAAINAGGVTIHSLFQLPFAPYLPTSHYNNEQLHFETSQTILRHFRVRSDKRSLIQRLELLIVDEVSMLRPDVLDAMELMLRHTRHNHLPFGGVQVLFIGDLQQLPPIIKPDEWSVLSEYYAGKYFFHARAINENQPIFIELTKIFRQSDEQFINILHQFRQNNITPSLIQQLGDYIDNDFQIKNHPETIVLTTHNQIADKINTDALLMIPQRELHYEAKIVDNFPAHLYPIDKNLILKEGAQVMFVKNDLSPEKRYYNGKIGIVKSLSEDKVVVYVSQENREIIVDEYEWEHKQYKHNAATNEIEEEVLGTYTQFPLRLAWAITIHKSQGLTFEKAAIDIANIFAPGQAYVALSRLTSLKGLVLMSTPSNKKLSTDLDIVEYEKNKSTVQSVENKIDTYTKDYLQALIMSAYDFSTTRKICETLRTKIVETNHHTILSKHKNWTIPLIKELEDMDEVAAKYQKATKQYFIDKQNDIKHIQERNQKACEFFQEKLIAIEKNIMVKLSDIDEERGLKDLREYLQEIENCIFDILRNIHKSVAVIGLIANKNLPTKQTIAALDLGNKLKTITEYRNHYSKYLFETRGIKAIKKEALEPKKSTYEQSYDLWTAKKSVEEIAAIRKLTEATIIGHLIKYVQLGEIQITDLIPLDVLKNMDKKLPKGTSLQILADLRSLLDNQYSFNELRLYRAWKEQS